MKRALYKIKGGKIFNHYPFINFDKSYINLNEISRNNRKYLNKEKINSKENYEKIEIRNNNIDDENEKYDNIKLLDIKDIKKNKYINDSKESISFSNHNYKYLDKKIDILGKALVNNINKIIIEINKLKNKDNNNEKIKYKNSKEKNIDENNMIIKSIKNKNSRNSFFNEKKPPLTFKNPNNHSQKNSVDKNTKYNHKLFVMSKDSHKN